MIKYFGLSMAFTIIALVLATWWGHQIGGVEGAIRAFTVAAILGVMEVSLSFDNAVVNASIIKDWDRFWRVLFLTVGVLIAVFGMRLIFPLLVVSLTANIGMLEVWDMAIDRPDEYSQHLVHHHAELSAFGGMFLLLVFLNYFLDKDKDIHWLHSIEEKLFLLGRVDAASVMVSLGALVISAGFISEDHRLAVMMAGVWGILTYLLVDFVSNFLEKEEEEPTLGKIVKRGSIGAFLYIEVLDASFSFDGVIGAFAITKDIVLIMLGLGIGAMFVRSMTVFLVEKGTLNEYIYLEHGAHWAIGILATLMLVSMFVHVPEVITGLIGVGFIGAAFFSSIREKKNMQYK